MLSIFTVQPMKGSDIHPTYCTILIVIDGQRLRIEKCARLAYRDGFLVTEEHAFELCRVPLAHLVLCTYLSLL